MRAEGLVHHSNQIAAQRNAAKFIDFAVACEYDLMHPLRHLFPIASQIDCADSDSMARQFQVAYETGPCRGVYEQALDLLARK